MPYPNQFQVNETWIAFQINDAPISTESDGDFDVMAIMDAASCFILGMEFVPASSSELSKMDAKRLLENGQSHKQELPKTLFVPTDQVADLLTAEAERVGIHVTRVPETELLVFIEESREGFRALFGGGMVQ